MVLDIYSRVAFTGCFIDAMTASLHSRHPEIVVTYPAKICKADSLGITPHFGKDIFDLWHKAMIPLLILMSRES